MFACVAVLQIGLNIVLDTWKPELLDPEYGERLHRVRALKKESPKKPLIVVLGSSRTEMGLSPSQIDQTNCSVFNYGMAGCGPVGEMVCLNRLLEAGIKPDRVVVEIIPAVLHGDGPIEAFVKMQRVAWSDLPLLAGYSNAPTNLYADWLRRRVGGWYLVRLCVVSRLCPGFLPGKDRLDHMWNTLDRFGWLPFPYTTIEPQKHEQMIVASIDQYAGHMNKYELSAMPLRAIERIIETCRENNIEIAFHLMPEGPRFRASYPPHALKLFAKYVSDLEKRHHIKVYDCRTWMDEDDFADSHHLLPQGAAKFSRRFGHEVIAEMNP